MNGQQNADEARDQEHLKLLSVFHYVLGGAGALFACFPIFHLIIGLVMVFSPERMGHGNPPPAFIGWFFVVFAAVFILAGWVMASLVFLAGRKLAQRQSHTFCFVIACIECLFMPLGTALGVFTIIVLMRPSVKKLFGVNPS